jgi:hypothetical protein
MGLFDKFFKSKPEKSVQPRTSETEHRPPPARKKTAKELATERGEAYVGIVSFDLNADDINSGSFELEWNDKFITNLVRAGYQMKPNEPEDVIVDRWFQNICRNVVMETWEQEQAMRASGIYVRTTDIGNGRSEVS